MTLDGIMPLVADETFSIGRPRFTEGVLMFALQVAMHFADRWNEDGVDLIPGKPTLSLALFVAGSDCDQSLKETAEALAACFSVEVN